MSQQSVREIFAIQALCSQQLKACVIHLLPVPVHGLLVSCFYYNTEQHKTST